MKRHFLIFLLTSICLLGYTQNLIPNHDFEQKTVKENINEKTHYSFPHWTFLPQEKKDITGIEQTPFFDFREYLINYTKNFRYYQSKYFPQYINPNTVTFYIPERTSNGDYKRNEDGHLICNETIEVDTTHSMYLTKNGNAYIRTVGSYKRNLFQVKLLSKIEKDSSYFFQMSYRIPFCIIKEEDIKKAILGIYFTNLDYNSPQMRKQFFSKNNIYTPQILFQEIEINSKDQWHDFSCTFTANDNYQFLIIGNHSEFNLFDTNYFKTKIPNNRFIIYFDDLILTKIEP